MIALAKVVFFLSAITFAAIVTYAFNHQPEEGAR